MDADELRAKIIEFQMENDRLRAALREAKDIIDAALAPPPPVPNV